MQSISPMHRSNLEERGIGWFSCCANTECIYTDLRCPVAAFDPDADSPHDGQECSGVCSTPHYGIEAGHPNDAVKQQKLVLGR